MNCRNQNGAINKLPALFGVDGIDDTQRQLACQLEQKSGLAIPDPTTTADTNWTTSIVVCGHLVAALQGTDEFRSVDHNCIMAAEKVEM
jgi:hypothetical protein